MALPTTSAKEGEQELAFLLTVKGYGHREQVVKETKATLNTILWLAFHSDYTLKEKGTTNGI